jgi:HSP20 family protein
MAGPPISRRWDPLREFQREVGRLFETLEPLQHWRIPHPYPPVNLYDGGDHYRLTAALPGLTPEDIELAITGETLTMRGERKRPEGTPEECYRRQERLFGRWSRTLNLPGRVDGGRAVAQFGLGILTITVPKAEDVRPKQIVVSAAS